jgi:hypothetical protein
MFSRIMFGAAVGALALFSGSHISAQGRGAPPGPLPPGQTNEPFPQPIARTDMRGPLYTVSADGKTVTPCLDTNDPKWGHPVMSQGRERGVQSIVLHPQFAQAGTPGFGKLYTFTDTSNQTPAPDFTTPSEKTTHDTVLLEWTARTPGAATYDSGAPREIFRLRQPFANHNGGCTCPTSARTSSRK